MGFADVTIPPSFGSGDYYTTSTAISSEQMLMDYIEDTLTSGLLRLEITSRALQGCINEAIEYYLQYTTMDQGYMSINLALGRIGDGGIKLPDYVKGVFSIDTDVRGHGINTLFTVENQLYMYGYYNFRNFDLVSWELVNEWLELKDRMLGQKIHYNFDHRTRKLYTIPKNILPNDESGLGPIGIIGVYTNPSIQSLWNKPWIRQYSVEAARLRAGEARKKYGPTNLLGGGNIDGQEWVDRATTRIKELMEELQDFNMDNEPVDFYIA